MVSYRIALGDDTAPLRSTAPAPERVPETSAVSSSTSGSRAIPAGQAAHTEPVARKPLAVRDQDSAHGAGAASAARERSARSHRDSGSSRSAQAHSEGSLARAAGWTAASSVWPGTGLFTTALKRMGLALAALLAAMLIGAFLVYEFADIKRTGLMLLTQRRTLVVLMVALVAAVLVWCAQILVTSLAQSTKERLSRGKRTTAVILACLLMAVPVVPGARGLQSLWAFYGLLGSDKVFGGGEGTLHGPDPWAGVGRINVMLLGQDSGQDREGTRPDTIMVASIDTETGHTALFSIPRNLENVRFPEGTPAADEFPDGFEYFGRNQDLINAVWTWAHDRPDLFEPGEDPGLTATTWAVEETLGLEINYYAMVNLKGFEDLVNAIGGVDMEVERRIPIGGGTNQATGRSYPIEGYIEPGMQKLDGYHALWYARSREGSDDFDRMCRQQRIVRVVVEEANPTTLALSVPGLVNATENNIETDVPTSDVDAFVELALRVKDAGFSSYPITPEVTNPGDADWDYLKEWVQASIEDSMKTQEAESVATAEPDAAQGKDPSADGSAGEDAAGEDGDAEGQSGGTGGSGNTAQAGNGSGNSGDSEGEGGEDSSASAKNNSSTPEPEIVEDPLQSCMPDSEKNKESD